MVKGTVDTERCVFLCDSSGSGSDAERTRFTTRVTQLAKEGAHEEAPPLAQLLFFWSRLATIIECNVLPALVEGKHVFMNGFGGTAYVHAAIQARSPHERAAILDLHKSMIRNCVIGVGVPPPTYLWLKPTPEIALRRRRADKELPRVVDPLKYIEDVNKEFEFYGRLEGQTVIPIDADQSAENVLREALQYIDPQGSLLVSKAA